MTCAILGRIESTDRLNFHLKQSSVTSFSDTNQKNLATALPNTPVYLLQ